uniref:Coenzyme Q-binding protein COQ10 START domain-containing protein n=1 Tax=Oryza glumipatula TaxID=40148 RepID=A0A0D9YKP1_9ORYZ
MAVLSSSSHGLLHPPLRLLAAASASSGSSYSIPHARLRLAVTTPSRLPSPISSSPDPPPDVAYDEDEQEGQHHKEERDERYGFEIQVRKLPKRNRRLVRARVRVDAPLDAVWATLTDYEGLAGFIPGLSECRLLDQSDCFARLYQVGEQDLALGFKFNARGTIDCYEGELQLLPAGARRREIAFNMIDGDFKVFEGNWSVQEEVDGGEISADQEFQTILSYVVELEPKLWVPVRLLEGRICNEIKTNLVSIREEAQRIQRLQDKASSQYYTSLILKNTLQKGSIAMLTAQWEGASRRFNRIGLHKSNPELNDEMRGFLRHAESRTPRAFVQLLAAQPPRPSAADQCHAAATKLGFSASNPFANTALLAFYCRSRRLREAQHLFDQMPLRTAVTWNTLIYGHAQSTAPDLAVRVQRPGRLRQAGECRCWSNAALRWPQQVFGEMEEKNVATFTALVTGFVLSRRPHDAVLLVREMERSGVAPNLMTYSSLLSSFASPEDIDHGKQVHCAVLKKGLEHDPFVLSALVTMYSKCGIWEDFVKVQMSVSCQDQVSFNSVISGLSCLGRGKEAFQHFLEMRRHGTDMDVFTFASILKAIGSSSSLLEGRQVHTLILKIEYDSVVDVQNSLISMYARHGAIGESNGVFISMEAPNLVSWNSLMSGCAQHGHGKEVVEMFEQMRRLHVQPDHITFLSVLTACSHVGLVDKGLEYFNLMKDKGYLVGARTKHYACMVDLLGRAGYLNEAEYLINGMPIKPGASVYRALLSACQIHGNLEIAIRVSKRLMELNPHDSSVHVQLSNAFAGDGRWGNAAEIRETMSGKGIVKEPSWSRIEDQMQHR